MFFKTNCRKHIAAIIIAIIIGTNVLVLTVPQIAQATIAGTGVKFTSCVAAGELTNLIKSQIDKQLESVGNTIQGTIQNKIGDKISQGITKGLNAVVSFFTGGAFSNFFGGTQEVHDAGVEAAVKGAASAQANRDYRDHVIARCVARTILTTMIANVNNFVRTHGRDGGAAFVTDWVDFEVQSQYRGEGVFRAMLSNSKLCDYFNDDVKQSYGVNPSQKINLTGQNTRTGSLQPFTLQTNCTMPSNFNIQNYQKDFSGNGGWNAFTRMLEPQNNYYGVLFMSNDEIEKQRALQQTADNTQIIANNGYTGESGDTKSDSCSVRDKQGECIFYAKIKTPGTYIAANVAAAAQAEFDWITSAQGLNTIIANATEVMLNRLLDFGNPDEGSYRLSTDDSNLANVPEPNPSDVSGPDWYSKSTSTETPVACTATGQAEQDFMLPLLNGGASPQDVVSQTNQKFGLTTGNEAVYYPVKANDPAAYPSASIGLPEFYLAEPDNKPHVPGDWFAVSRCTSGGGGGSGGSTGEKAKNPPT